MGFFKDLVKTAAKEFATGAIEELMEHDSSEDESSEDDINTSDNYCIECKFFKEEDLTCRLLQKSVRPADSCGK